MNMITDRMYLDDIPRINVMYLILKLITFEGTALNNITYSFLGITCTIAYTDK